MKQGSLWNIFGILRATHWIQDRFLYLLDPCLLVISWKNGSTYFHKIFRIGLSWHGNNLEHIGDDLLNPLNTGFIFLFSGSVFANNIKDTGRLIFMKSSGYGHKKELARLFDARLDCFALLKQAAAEVCALRVLLVSNGSVNCAWENYIIR